MILNLALKINVYDELKNNPNFSIPKQDIDNIFRDYGKYRDKTYWNNVNNLKVELISTNY